MTRFIVAVECALEYDGRFLIIERPKGKHGGGMLSFPGGKVEMHDGTEEKSVLQKAAQREVSEEVGLQIDPDKLLFVTSSSFEDTVLHIPVINVVFHYILEEDPGPLQVCQEEVPSYAWLSKKEALIKPNCPEWLERYLRLISPD